MSFLRNIARIIMPVFMLVIMIYLANATVNQHFHQLDSGMMIKHAHPFENKKPDNPFEKHHHTSSELVLLDQISSNTFWIYLYILLVSSVFFTFSAFIIRDMSAFKHPDLYFLKNYHAPPETLF